MKIARTILMSLALLAAAQPAVSAPQSLFPSRQLGASSRLGASNRPFQPPILPQVKNTQQRPAPRPEIRSYQPYTGLQYRFRPKPPVERSIRAEQPEITRPKRVEPLFEDGHLSLGYAYCLEPRENVGLPSAPFSGPPAPSRTCP